MFALFLAIVFGPPLAALLVGSWMTTRGSPRSERLGIFVAVLGGVAATLAFEWLAGNDEDFVEFKSMLDWMALASWVGCSAITLGILAPGVRRWLRTGNRRHLS